MHEKISIGLAEALIATEIENVESLHEKCRREIVKLELQEKALRLLLRELRQNIEELRK